MRLKIIVLVFLGFFSFKNIFSQSIGNPSLPTVSQEEIIGSASVCGNYEENYAVIFETGDEECSFFYTWNVEGGIITANNDTTITGESISSVKVTWDPSKSDHQISFTATNQIQPADDGGGGSFCTSEDIVQKNGSLDINVFGNASTPLDLANWKFDDTSNDKSYACVENENIIVTQTTPMISGAQTRLTYTTDGGATIHTIKDWDQLSVGGEYNFTPSFDKMHVKVTFFNEVRYKNCIDKYEDDEFVMDFYVEPEFQKISTYDPQCEGENGSVTYEITRGSASSVIVFLDRPSGSDDSFQVEVDANNRFSLSSSDSVKKYNATAETFTKVPLNLPADTYNITLEPLIRKDKGEDAENLCFQAKTFIIKDPPSVTPKSNFSSTSYTVDCSYSTAKVEYQLQRSGDTNAKFDYRIYAADGTTIVTSDYNSSEKLSKTLGYGDYTIMAKYSDCSWSNSDAVKERNISINYHNVDFTSGYPKTSDLLDNDKHLNCSSDTDASIFVKANDTQNGLVKYKLTKVTGSNQGTEWLTGKNENEQHEFPNLGAGRYIIDAYYNGCDTRSDRATVNITAPNPIIISKVTESTPTCFGGDDGYFDFTFNGENNSNFSITSVIVKNDGETLDENSYSYSGTIVKELSAGDEVVYLEVTESGGTNLSDCHGDITLSEKMSNPSDYFQFERQIIKDPICYDSEATFKYSFQNEEGTVIRTLLDANLDPVTDPNIIENADSIIFYGPARNSTYFLQLEDGFPCTILSDPISFNIPDQPSMANPKVNEAEGGIELNGEYYVQCKDDKISITWPINFDSNTGNVSDDFTITKNGVELDEDNGDYITYADSIVLHNANVIGSIATTYRITGTDGDGCTLSEADNSNSFTLRQVENEFKLDDVETKIKVWYKDKDSSDYHLKHAADTLGTIFMKAMGGMTLEDGSQNYIYSLFDADADTLITESVDKGANDIYAFDSLLQAHKNYRVEVKDQLGCLKSFPFKLNAPDTIKIETTLNTSYAGGVNIACKNGTDTVKVQTSGGLYPHFVELKSGENTYFSQTINSSEDTVVFPNVSAGNYYIQVIDKSDNSHYPSGFRYMTRFENFDMVEPEDSVDFNYTMNEPTCFYSLDGELTITPSGGIPFENDEYVMVFYNEAGTIVLDSIRGTSATYIDSAGFYKVEVYDANSFNYNTSCSIKDSVLEIKNIPQLKTDILYSDYPLCLGDSTGKIHVRATGGRSAENYSFELYDSTKTLIDSLILSDTNEHIFENLFSGQYTVKIYDEVSCEFSQDIFLKERTDTLKIVNLKPIESTCSNTIDAAIDVTTSGGDGRHSLSIDQGQNWIQLDSGDYNYQFTDLAGGQLYEIWLKDENYYENSYQSSCLIIDNVEIARTDSVMLSADVEQVSCFGGNDGSIKINPSYGENTNSENFSFEWYKNGELLENETSDQIENLSRGSYNVKVTYGNIDCSQKSLEIGISQPSKPFAIDSITAQAYNCETSDPLKLQVNLSGGWISQKYKVQIDNLIPDSVQIDEYNTLSVYENLEYGDHQITVWDAKGCEVSDSFSIDYQRPVIDVIEVSNVNCNGEATGSIKVSGQYEIMDYYLWNDSIDFDLESQHQDSVLFNGLAAGQYNLWNKKGNCSSDTIIITITEPTKLQLNPYIVSEATCGQNNGQLDVNIEGGTPPYLTTWLNSIDPNAVGTGDYRVTVEDSLGCSFTSEISMIEVSPIEIVIDSLKDSYCNLNNGFAEVSVNGASPPFTINWNGVESGNSKSGLSPGQYEIEVVDALECTQSISFEIKEPLPVKTNVVEYREAECNIANGYIRFEYENLKSPYEIIWPESLNSLDDFSANGLAAGEMYSLQIIDSADCSHEFSFNIPDKSDLSIDFEVKRPSCENENGLIKAEVTGGSGDYNYTWSTGEENLDSISNLSAGFYFLTVEDALGCKVTDSVSLVDDPNVFPGYEIIKTEPTCLENDGVIEIQFLEQDHDFEIYWPNHFMVSNRMENLTAGIYSVVLRNPDGCNKEISIELATFQKPNLEVESIKMPGCGNANGEILITESSDLNYVWSNPSIGNTFHAENLFAGNYWVYAETQSQCKTDTLFFTLDNIDSDLLIQTQSIISNSCPNSNDGSIQINVSGGVPPYSYLWNDPEQQTQAEVIDLKAGNYTVLVTDANDCSTSKSFNLQSENPVFIASFEQIEPQCSDSYDGSLTVNVGGGKGNYTYEWSNGDTTQTADSLALGNYSVKVYDGTNCFVYEEVTLTGPNPIDIQLESGMPICRGEATGYANLNIFGGSGEYDVLWEDGNTQASRSDLASGSHLVSIQDDNGCEREFEIVVPVKKDINVQYTVIEPSCFGASDGQIEINNVFNAANPYVEWEDGPEGFCDKI
ncbi:SprB repeat-containing protein [Marivirga tractuosa]|uniref:hypothetical protein n=1 Tax=Marivirga tractuosa TaxID=1006 RepID=UPI0035CF7449